MIFYYTGTGNSKYASEKIADSIGGEIISITDCLKNARYEYKLERGEVLGFVFPVYCWTIPNSVKVFIQKLKIDCEKDTYSFALANCGGSTGNALRHFTKYYPVSAAFGIPMIDNYLPLEPSAPSLGEIELELDRVDIILDSIITDINDRKTGDLNKYRGSLGYFGSAVMSLAYCFARKTNRFKVSDKCTGCGLCENICNCNAISIENDKPVWIQSKCDMCYGCLNRCPKNAISLPKTEGKGQYVNTRTII